MLCVIFLYSNKNIMIKNILPLLFLTCIFYSCKQEINNKNSFTVTKVTDSVYSIISPNLGLPTPENKGWNSNSHFIITKRGVLLFDSGSSETIGFKIKKAIQKVTNLPVLWIVNSHSHADHWLGNAAFKETVVEIIASNKTHKSMKKYGKEDVEFYFQVTKGTIGDTKLMFPTVLLNHGQKRKFGEIDVEFIFSNDGHSPGDLLMWLPKQKIIFGGDVLSSDWMPMITNYKNVLNLVSTLNFIANLNPTIVLTGHGNASTEESIKRDADLLSIVWKQVKSDFEKGKNFNETLENIKAKLEPKYKSLYKDFNSEIKRHVNLMYKLQQ